LPDVSQFERTGRPWFTTE